MIPPRPTWLEIDLSAISNNIEQLRKRIAPTCKLMGVVKANAYGHGAVQVARTVINSGADYLAVATLSEAIELRNAEITGPILVLGFTPHTLAQDAVTRNIALTVYDLNLVKHLDEAAKESKKKACVHVKINTGMNRLGIAPQQCVDFVSRAAAFPHVNVEGIYTHFATADEEDISFVRKQFSLFHITLNSLEEINLRPPIAHAANSAATLSLPETHLDMVRPGIATYGLHPDPVSCRLPAGFKAALTWKAQIAHINQLQVGDAVSYGREFVAVEQSTIAVIPVGYADGFPRKPQHWKHVLIAGKPAPVAGRVCMDQTMVDISSHCKDINHGAHGDRQYPAIKQGDEVVLIGHQGDASLTAEDIANQIGTNNYDVISRILSRVPRIYV